MDSQVVMVLVIFFGVLILYFVPSFVAHDKKYSSGIFVLNLFLGWTLLGWVGALIWAVSSPKKESVTKVVK